MNIEYLKDKYPNAEFIVYAFYNNKINEYYPVFKENIQKATDRISKELAYKEFKTKRNLGYKIIILKVKEDGNNKTI